jgi:hypothetical protein
MPDKINDREPLDMHEREPHVCSQKCPCGHWSSMRRYAEVSGRRRKPNLDVIENNHETFADYEDYPTDCE